MRVTPGTTGTVTGQISFSSVTNLDVTLTATGAAPSNNDTVSFGGFSIQLQIPTASPVYLCAESMARVLGGRRNRGHQH